MGVDGVQKQASCKEFADGARGGTGHGGSKTAVGGDNIYRPPHARHQDKTLKAQQRSRDVPVKPRRPDRAVYVPRAKRLMTSSDVEPKLSTKQESSQLHITCSSSESESIKNDNCIEQEHQLPQNNCSHNQTPKKLARRSFCNIYTPPHARLPEPLQDREIIRDKLKNNDLTIPSNIKSVNSHCVPYYQDSCYLVPNINSELALEDILLDSEDIKLNSSNSTNECIENSLLDNENSFKNKCTTQDSSSNVSDLNIESNINVMESTFDISENGHSGSDISMNDVSILQSNIKCKNHAVIIEDVCREQKKDLDNDENELKRVSEVINRSNRRIIKQTFVSDVLIISDPVSDESHNISVNDKPANNRENDFEERTIPPEVPKQHKILLSREDNDWDTLFDDDGECLDPTLLAQLTETVGKVHIQKPRASYEQYQSRGQIMVSGPQDEMFGHVIEVYNFPQEFKTHDLMSVFATFKDTGFEIKWVDDTHALAVFSSSKIAAEVLAYNHPIVRTRALHEATLESRQKARKSAEFLQPYRPRPETCTALARRLVTGALGVKLSTAKQERMEERRIIKEAREKKRQAALMREAAWEGTLENQTEEHS